MIYHTFLSVPVWMFTLLVTVVCLVPDLVIAVTRQLWKDTNYPSQKVQIQSFTVETYRLKTLGFDNEVYNGSSGSLKGNHGVDYNENQNCVTIA